MKKRKCLACGYVYDPAVGFPDAGIAPGTLFEQLPEETGCVRYVALLKVLLKKSNNL
jgi:rubredoxin